MSTQLNGYGSLVSRPAVVAIASTTIASPISVTTSTPHGLTTGDTVLVRVVTLNVPANGIWVVTVVDSTHVTLNGSTGSGAGGAEASATIQSLGFNATFAIPSDLVEDLDASSINVAFEALADRSAWNSERTGPYFVVDEDQVTLYDSANPPTTQWSDTANGSASYVLINATPNIEIYGAKDGDLIQVDFQASSSISGATPSQDFLAPFWTNDGGSPGRIHAAGMWVGSPVAGIFNSVSMHSCVPVPSSPSAHATIQIGWWRDTTHHLLMLGEYWFRARLLRAI